MNPTNEYDETNRTRPAGEGPPVPLPDLESKAPTIAYPTLPAQYALDDDTRTDDTRTDDTRTDAPPRVRRPLRVRTVVFGLVMLTISVISLVALLTDVRVDSGVVGLGLLIGAGAALVAGGVATAVREAKSGPGAVR